ncbi:MAG TPA: TonB family protein [Longimicrobiaceae bacterium]|nr:TonB family protein [Longimicrobiaceae bacterium]
MDLFVAHHMSGLERLLVGRVLGGRYTVEELVAQGRGGAVYRARDAREEDAQVALKVPAAPRTPEARERFRAVFRREAGVAAGLRHANLAAVLGWGTDPELDLDYFVTELLRGETLSGVLAQRGKPPATLALRLFADAADGTAAAHAAGLVHRDLRPASLFLVRSETEKQMRVRVAGFGVPQLVPRDSLASTDPRLVGYAPPELLAGGRLTQASDVYGLGVIGFELLTGELPFDEGARRELAAGRPAQVQVPGTAAAPGHLMDAILQALQLDPAARFPHAGAFAAALRQTPAPRPAPVPSVAPAAPAATVEPATVVSSSGPAAVDLPLYFPPAAARSAERAGAAPPPPAASWESVRAAPTAAATARSAEELLARRVAPTAAPVAATPTRVATPAPAPTVAAQPRRAPRIAPPSTRKQFKPSMAAGFVLGVLVVSSIAWVATHRAPAAGAALPVAGGQLAATTAETSAGDAAPLNAVTAPTPVPEEERPAAEGQQTARERAEEARKAAQEQALREAAARAAAQQTAAAPPPVQAPLPPREAPAVPPRPQPSAPATPQLAVAPPPAPPPAEEPRPAAPAVYDLSAVEQRPSLVNGAEIQRSLQDRYPGHLRQGRVEGQVTATFVVGTDGRVDGSTIRIVNSPNAGFNTPTTGVLRRARFRPATVNGQPVKVQVTMPVTWNIDD